MFLKGHSGGTLRVDRGSRPADLVPQAALTLGLAVQPDVLQRAGEVRELRGRGLLARAAYSVPISRVGDRDSDAAPVGDTVQPDWCRRIGWALDWPVPPLPSPAVDFDDAARAELVAFRRALEPRLRPQGDLAPIADWANKRAGHLARWAGLLLVGDTLDSPGTEMPLPPIDQIATLGKISGSLLRRAVTIEDYATPHALAAFGFNEPLDRHIRSPGASSSCSRPAHGTSRPSWGLRSPRSRAERCTESLRQLPPDCRSATRLGSAGGVRVACRPHPGPGRPPGISPLSGEPGSLPA